MQRVQILPTGGKEYVVVVCARDPEALLRLLREFEDAFALSQRDDFIGFALNNEEWPAEVLDLGFVVELVKR